MASSGSKAVIRVGELINDANQDMYKTINWSDIPAGNDLNIRMSGLCGLKLLQELQIQLI